MKNLFLPDVDLSLTPQFNHNTFKYWSLINESSLDYTFFENAFSSDEVNNIIKLGRSFPVDQSKTADGRSFSKIRKSYNSWIPPCDLTQDLYAKIQELVFKANKLFEFDLESIEHLQYTEYDSDYEGYYDSHIDKSIRPPYPNSHRKLSFSIQLSDEKTYEGGDLQIYTGTDPIIANRNKGTINFFPSYILHRVIPVTKGFRCCLVGWVSGPKFR